MIYFHGFNAKLLLKIQWLNLAYCHNNVFLLQTCNKMIWHQNIFNLELELGICKGLSKIYYDLTKGDVGFQEN